jgi:hypothetical protein
MDVAARMRMVMFGLAVSASWGDGHAATWFERGAAHYAAHGSLDALRRPDA